MLTTEQVEAFHRDGFLSPIDVMSEDEALQIRAELEAAADEKKSKAQARADNLAEISITIPANASDEGKLFGSIGARDIAEAITVAGEKVTKSEVRLPQGPLRELGDHYVDIQLHTEITQTMALTIVATQNS